MNNKKFDFSEDMPLGLGMAIAQNSVALEKFSGLSDDEKKELISGAHEVKSKNEMRSYVDAFAEGNVPKINR